MTSSQSPTLSGRESASLGSEQSVAPDPARSGAQRRVLAPSHPCFHLAEGAAEDVRRNHDPRDLIAPFLCLPRSISKQLSGSTPFVWGRRGGHLSRLRDLRSRRCPVHPNGNLAYQPWGMREFAILDNDGNLIKFADRQPSRDHPAAAGARYAPVAASISGVGGQQVPADGRPGGGAGDCWGGTRVDAGTSTLGGARANPPATPSPRPAPTPSCWWRTCTICRSARPTSPGSPTTISHMNRAVTQPLDERGQSRAHRASAAPTTCRILCEFRAGATDAKTVVPYARP